MPRESSNVPRPPTETSGGLRGLAAHARRLATTTLDEQAANELSEFADELEARTTALEPALQIVSREQASTVPHSDPDLGQ
jgi:hypothetical protein